MQEIQEQMTPKAPFQENGVDDFSFVCLNPDGSPISAEDAFVDGHIRPVFPIFDQRILTAHDDAFKVNQTTALRPQLKKLFMEDFICSTDDRTRVSPEIYCEWSPQMAAPTPAPELGKKSYSTGFSKLWRFGDKIRRSSSDGNVFLRSASSGSAKGGSGSGSGGGEKAEKKRKEGKVKAKGGETASYYYARNRAENEMNKRKSYLPYRSNLMGFFTAPNGLNRNF